MSEHERLQMLLQAVRDDSAALGFSMACDALTGQFLRALAASKPGGRFLELGTGTGESTAWLLAGMDGAARLETVELEAAHSGVAQRHLGHDPRVSFQVGDGAEFLDRRRGEAFDLIFADTWPGKFWHLNEALALLAPGGLYVVDDLLPQPNWPDGHGRKVETLVSTLSAREDLATTRLNWSTGLMVCVKLRPRDPA